MADAPEEQFFEIPLANMGMQPLSPERTYQNSALADVCNLVTDYDGLRRRPALVRNSFGPTTYDHPLAESPIALEGFQVAGQAFTYVMLTSRSLFHRNVAGTWVDVTPTYVTGTASIVNGTTALTGIGTTWLNGGATGVLGMPGMSILLGGAWYSIASFASNTTATLAQTYTGVTLVGAAYTLRLNWNLAPAAFPYTATLNPDRGFIVRQNGDVYVAGMIGQDRNAAISASINIAAGAVLKLAHGSDYAGAITPATVVTTGVTQIFASGATSGTVGFSFFPRGFDQFEDGRLIMLVHWVNSGVGNGSGANRLMYSSNLSIGVWLGSPAGFTDISFKNGAATGLARMGRVRTIHFTDGIVIAEPTGLDDPPLNYSESKASIGSVGPWAIQNLPEIGGQAYVGCDMNLRVFNGDFDVVIVPDWRRLLMPYDNLTTEIVGAGVGVSPIAEFEGCQLFINQMRGELHFLYARGGYTGGTGTNFTHVAIFNYRQKTLYRNHYASQITMIAKAFDASTPTTSFPQRGELIMAGPSRDSTLALQAQNFCLYSSFNFQDTTFLSWASGETGLYGFVTDVLDFDQPNTVKAITRVGVLASTADFTAIDPANTFRVDIIQEGNDPLVPGQLLVLKNNIVNDWYSASPTRQVKWLTFDPVSGGTGYRLRIRTTDVTQIFRWKLAKLIVGWVPTGDNRTIGP